MKERISILPRWVLTGTNPAFYDMESKTCVEQTARVYVKVQEIVNDYNKFADEVEDKLLELDVSNKEDYESFKNNITHICHEFIHSIESKVNVATDYMKDNLSESVRNVVDAMIDSGELNSVVGDSFNELNTRVTTLEKTEYKLVLDEGTENLTLVKEVSE